MGRYRNVVPSRRDIHLCMSENLHKGRCSQVIRH